MNKGMNAPRFIESFREIPKGYTEYLKSLYTKGELQHIRIPGGTLSQDYFPTKGGGDWIFKDGKPLIDYIPILRELKIPVLYVANLLYEDQIEETMYALDLLFRNGISVLGVELGNELYTFDNRHGIKYIFALDNTDKTKLNLLIADLYRHVDTIKRRYDLKISVPISKPLNRVNKRWNEEAFKLKGIDAYSYHVYIDFGKEIEQLKQHGDFIRSLKSKGKEVWVTEYNMQFNTPLTNNNNFLSKKHLDMLHYLIPSMCSTNGANIISRHSLVGNNEVSPFFAHISITKDNTFIINDKLI